MERSNSFKIPNTSQKRIVIIGGGFAGLAMAKKFAGKDVQVVLLDRHNYHTFQPLLYQVATGGLEPDSIAYPIRKILQGYPNFYFRLAQVQEVDIKAKTITTNIGAIRYDYLVLAIGSQTNFYGIKGIETMGMPVKSIPQALNMRSMMLENFEQALLTDDIHEREALMN